MGAAILRGTARTWAVALHGVEGRMVEVEADLASGIPGFTLVGLPDAAVNESRDRVRAALVNCGHTWPARRITVGLSPASIRKVGAAFDLAIAASILAAAGEVPRDVVEDVTVLGELGLDGRVRRVTGILPMTLAAVRHGHPRVIVPKDNVAEARLVPGVLVRGVVDLDELVPVLRGDLPGEWLPPVDAEEMAAAGQAGRPAPEEVDLDQVVGQEVAKAALEVCAAGGHHLLMVGPPGCGKTMLAERLPGLLPDLDRDTALEVTTVHSVTGALSSDRPLVVRPPWRNPHHSATLAALVGGGTGALRPGAVSQAHRGVLFLDEAPEFSPHVLDALRQPLESGVVEIARSAAHARFPARFQLVLAANPCPCGLPVGGVNPCRCTSVMRMRYFARLSGPLLDRIDVKVTLGEVVRADLLEPLGPTESSATVRSRVEMARERQRERLAGTTWSLNAHVPGSVIRARFPPTRGAMRMAAGDPGAGGFTGRGMDKVLRLAWTLADLRGVERPGEAEVAYASFLRDAR